MADAVLHALRHLGEGGGQLGHVEEGIVAESSLAAGLSQDAPIDGAAEELFAAIGPDERQNSGVPQLAQKQRSAFGLERQAAGCEPSWRSAVSGTVTQTTTGAPVCF